MDSAVRLRNLADIAEYAGLEGPAGDMRKAADELDRLAEQQWVPVSERLPEEGKIVIIAGGVGHHRSGVWYTDTAQDAGRIIQWEVTHWMPLPSPPEDTP